MDERLFHNILNLIFPKGDKNHVPDYEANAVLSALVKQHDGLTVEKFKALFADFGA